MLPPGAAVAPHQHPEAAWWFVLAGEFRFTLGGTDVGDPGEAVVVGPGAFLLAPPHVRHRDAHLGDTAGRLLGMLLPGGDGGLETFFRQMGVPVRGPADVPDLDRPVEHLQATIAAWRGAG